MKIIRYPDRLQWKELIVRPAQKYETIQNLVTDILQDVKQNGDKAVLNYTRKFDYEQASSLKIPNEWITNAHHHVDDRLKKAIDLAAQNIRTFHASQLEQPKKIETQPGVTCWRKKVPIERVGLYIPGGSAPLFSTLLMLAIPAQIAGCREIIVCSPPNKDGTLSPVVLYIAQKLNLNLVYACGGAQAIAAMAFGTESIPAVYKIFGPGNAFVTEAKQQIQQYGVAIDLPAGPSEVLVMADHTANPAFIAADLLSQAEHGADSQVMLITQHEPLVQAVVNEIDKQLKDIPRRCIAEQSLQNSWAIVLSSKKELIDFSNGYAPEHLIIHCNDPEWFAERVTNAGSVFLGTYSPESAGDYASGTNHTLPTYGFARSYSGVSIDSFVKKITFQEITRKGLQNIGSAIIDMAKAEGLDAHAKAVEIRLQHDENR